MALGPLLGGITAAAFLRRHWQKAAHLARAAMPGFDGVVDRDALFALAARDDVESRLVQRIGARWSLAHGPFTLRTLRALPARNWTLLVQGVNLHVPAADALLRRFRFVPYARLDDLMVSYAAPGGGVGPHLDAYDVFLLQGFGRRRWRYGRQDDQAFRPGLPLRVLRRFTPTEDAILAPGDMLYLPPAYAHDGVALEPCTTYSIGFRAATASETAAAFLTYLQDSLDVPGRYADPDLAATREPARISPAMLRKVVRMVNGITWNATDIARFLGSTLSEPKPSVYFEPPSAPLSRAALAKRIARGGLRLDLRTQFLYDDACFYMNGSVMSRASVGVGAARTLEALANDRALPPARGPRPSAPVHAPAQEPLPSVAVLALIYDWYVDGYVHPGNA